MLNSSYMITKITNQASYIGKLFEVARCLEQLTKKRERKIEMKSRGQQNYVIPRVELHSSEHSQVTTRLHTGCTPFPHSRNNLNL